MTFEEFFNLKILTIR